MVDESNIAINFFSKKFNNPVSIDVGAHMGYVTESLIKKGWNVYAFEPNPHVAKRLIEIIQKHKKNGKIIKYENKCIGDTENEDLTFYLSNVSHGISSLVPFHESHEEASFKVSTIRLDNYMKKNDINHVNFLKVDSEGYDYIVLKSYPWNLDKPDVIVCEFEDLKTKKKLNYTWKDMAEYIKDLGYNIIVSEWFPIVRYGIKHKWRTFKKYPCDLEDCNAWGNFICIKDKNHYESFVKTHSSKFK